MEPGDGKRRTLRTFVSRSLPSSLAAKEGGGGEPVRFDPPARELAIGGWDFTHTSGLLLGVGARCCRWGRPTHNTQRRGSLGVRRYEVLLGGVGK